jgi:hypothetical protein
MKDKRCKCSMSISMLGDGCRYCQPQEYIETLQHLVDDLDEEFSTVCEIMKSIKADLLMRAVEDDKGSRVVDLSSSLWLQLNEVIEEA